MINRLLCGEVYSLHRHQHSMNSIYDICYRNPSIVLNTHCENYYLVFVSSVNNFELIKVRGCEIASGGLGLLVAQMVHGKRNAMKTSTAASEPTDIFQLQKKP